MKVFIDTSSLFKLYHYESGTDELIRIFELYNIERIYLAEITKIEFSSVVWKKCREKLISPEIAKKVINIFNEDAVNYYFIFDDKGIKENAVNLIAKYWQTGLRTLDSIQLACALEVKDEIEYVFTSDNILAKSCVEEGIATL